MKTPEVVSQTRFETVLCCADCGIYTVATIDANMKPEHRDTELCEYLHQCEVEVAKRIRCRCELKGDISDFDVGMRVKSRGGITFTVHGVDRVDGRLTLANGSNVPAKFYRPEWA